VGRDLARETGLPWIADYRDPWTRRIAYDPPTALHHRWHLRAERELVAAADRVVVTADETRDDFLARIPGLDPARVAVIPNGFDRDDFLPPNPPPWDRFRLHYVGQLTAGRSIAPLLRVIGAFLAAEPRAREVIEVRCVGPREVENDRMVAESGLGDVVRLDPPVPHKEAVRILADAHVLLLVENLGPRGGLIAQGKLYECLYAGRPLLAVVPPGAVDRLVRHHGAGLATDGGDVEVGVEFLRRAFAAWSHEELLPVPSRESLARYERRSLTAELAALLDAASR
jgi:glycosyltransferase involved in cell wall biosynthesis